MKNDYTLVTGNASRKKCFNAAFVLMAFIGYGLISTIQAQTQIGADIDGEAVVDLSGASVSMPDANTVAIGANLNDATGDNAGHVRIYSWDGSAWVPKGTDIDGEATSDQSGYSVSMPDANTVAIGAPQNDGNGSDAGHVRIYSWDGSAWVQQGADIDGETAGDQSGYSVSMPDANTVAIGAVFNDGNGSDAGQVRIYSWNGSAWVQQGADIDGEALGDQSGNSVSMPDANTVAIGANFNDEIGVNAGHVRIYSWDGSAWVPKGTDIDGEATSDQSGYSVSMPDANTVAIGAKLNDGNGFNAGYARIYTWSGTAWLQKGTDIDGEAAGDNSGYSVSMPDANTVAIGAVFNDGNGSNAGQVRIHSWDGSVWVQQGADIDGEASGDRSGFSVSMPDANTVAVGAQMNSGNVFFAGHVRVYSLGSSCDVQITNVTATDESCPGADDGSVTASATCGSCAGGDSDIRYSINNVDFTNTTGVFTGLADGSYTVYVQDVNDDSCSDNDGVYTINTENNDCGSAPANNDCVNAEAISAAPYPAGSTSLGTLWGATASGSGSCGSPTDVFYSLNVPFDNHYFINVNPFGGADIAWELLDACGGASSGCVDNSGAGVGEAAWLLGLAAGDYILRVSGSAASEAGGQFLINVQSFPTAQVQDNPANPLYACNQAGFQLEDFVGASPQNTPGVLDYEWLVAEVGGGTLTEWQRGGPNYVSRCSWLGMDYGKTYNVFVRLLLDIPGLGPTWGVYQGDYQTPFASGASSCTIATGTSVTPTWVRPNYTPTNAQGNDYALCDFVVAYNVSNSENFRWRFEGNGTPGDPEDIIYTRGSGNPSVRLSWVNGLVPGNVYGVAVEVQVAGNWSGYSITYPIILALPPNDVQLRGVSCGATVAPNGYILSESVCEADNYTFEFVPQGGGTTITYTASNYVCFLNNLSPNVVPGTTYDVRVKVSQGGVAGDYGAICDVTISGPVAPGSGMVAQRDVTSNGAATLFPNPNAGEEVRVNLEGLSAGNHEVMISIYDVYGKQISTQGFGHEGTSLNRLIRFDGNLAMGMYMVQIVVDGEKVATARLVVQ